MTSDVPVLKDCNTERLADAARTYNALGYKILKLRPKSKMAYGKGWSDPSYEDPASHWSAFPEDNIGLPLGRNRIFAIDIDRVDEYTKAMAKIRDMLAEETGVETMFTKTPTVGISSGRPGSAKYLFRIPAGLENFLEYRSLDWRNHDGKSHSVVEFRCGDGCQDVLPPSIHPSGSVYRFTGADTLAEMPYDLCYLVRNWSHFSEKLLQANPEYVRPVDVKSGSGKVYRGEDYAQMWCDKEYLPSWLSKYGYTPAKNRRFLSPHSQSGSPGIVLFADMKKFWSFGASDPFCDGRPHSAYDLLVHYEYHGSYKDAWRYVLQDLRVNKSRNLRRNAVWE